MNKVLEIVEAVSRCVKRIPVFVISEDEVELEVL